MAAPSLTIQQQGVTQVSADNLNTYEQTCDTFSQLRAFVGTAGVQVYARGQSAVSDGYQGNFYWNASLSGAIDDNVNTIIPGGVTLGGWQRLSLEGFSGANSQLITNTAATTYTTPAYITTATNFKFTLQGGGGGGGAGGRLRAAGPYRRHLTPVA